tara:strand:- start:18 stop:359 length:342 start_codon:yes stop_codon:yes gene_type:complete
MKRTEETLRSMIRAELQNISEALRDEMAQKIMEEVCKKALIEARFTDVKVEQLQEGVTKSTALWAMHDEMRPHSTHIRSRLKMVPAERFTQPLLIDIKEMIDEEMQEWPGGKK